MTILATETATGLAATGITGRTLDNGNGGAEAFTWKVFTGGEPCYGDGAGKIAFSSNSMSIVRDSRIRKLRTYFDPNAGVSNIMLTGFGLNDASHLGARRIALLWTSSYTSLRIVEITTVGGGLTTRVTKTTTAPSAPVWLELDATTGTTVHARVYAADGTTLLHDIEYAFPRFPMGDGWGFGGYQGGNVGRFDDITYWDGPVAPSPLLGTPTATSTGAGSTSATVSTDKASGTLYALFSSATPDDATIIGTGTAFAVTAAGAQTVTLSGLTHAATGKVHVVHVLPTLERSSVARSNAITLDDPLPAPTSTVETTIGTVGGQLAIIVSGVSTNASGVSVAMPAAATPNGAISRPSQAVVPDGGGNWLVAFVNPPYGTYAPATMILSNPDNPVVNKSGERGVDIIPIEGSDVPDGSEVPDVPVAFSGPVPAQSATVGSAFSVSLASFFTGTRVPFTYALLSGSLAGSGLALSGSTISGTPTTATTLAGLVVRATDADGATADTNAFGITVAQATVAPSFSVHPQSQAVVEGGAAELTFAVTGTAPIALQVQSSGNAGSTWADVAGATASPFNTGALALAANGRLYRVRATGPSGVPVYSASATMTVSAAADTTKPVMTGAITITAKTHSSYTSSVDPATDAVGVTGYRVSHDGGATWIDKGTARTHDHTGRAPGATDQVRWSARDAAGNWADALAVAVTLDAAPVEPPSGPIARMSRNAYFDLLMRCGS